MAETSAFGLVRDPAEERVLILSPHPDDAVWSVGSLIADLSHHGAEVVVASLFTEIDVNVRNFGAQWLKRSGLSPSSAAATRRLEDQLAVSIVGARAIHVGLLDAVSRCPKQYCSSPSLAGQTAVVGSHDLGPAQCQASVEQLIREISPTVVLLPLGHGRHVDHQIVSNTEVDSGRVLYYEDFPYTILKPFVAADRLAQTSPDTGLTLVHLPSDLAVQQHLEAAQAYRSQVAAFFGSAYTLQRQIRRHLNQSGRAALRLLQPGDPAPT